MRRLIRDLNAIRKFISSDGKLDKSEVASLLSFIQRHIKEEGFKDPDVDELEQKLRSINDDVVSKDIADDVFSALSSLATKLRKRYWRNAIARFVMYIGRWQLSTPIYSLVLYFVSDKFGYTEKTIIANLIGACIFFWIDMFIFSKK